MRHAPPKSAGCRTCHTRWSFHLKGSLSSHLGLCDPIHIGHYMRDGQRFEFLSDVLSATTLVGPGEPDNPCYMFLVAYRDANVSGC